MTTISGRKVLVYLVAFFATVTAVNGVFIYQAVKTYPGLSAENAYRTGLAYNRVLAAAEAQRALGWRVKLERARVGETDGLRLSLADRDGSPIQAPKAIAELRRPAHRGDDRRVDFAPVGPGIYAVALPEGTKGAWDVVILIERPDGGVYRAEHRLWAE